MNILNVIKFNIKNLLGWHTKRKIVAFSVDDYGNVRLDSKEAGDRMKKSGLNATSKFDLYDSLENRKDLEMLFETLSSVTDSNGNHAVFTPLAVPCNIDFEKVIESDYKEYFYELLPQTYLKLEKKDPNAYSGAWKLWQEGISSGLFIPQFHGREHFNLKLFNEKLKTRDISLLISLQNRSNAIIMDSNYPTIIYTAAFQFWDFRENDQLQEIIKDGLMCFEKVFGKKAIEFNAPGGFEHPVLHNVLYDNGVKYLYTSRTRRKHLGFGNYRIQPELFYTGKKNIHGQNFIVKNCVFEPSEDRGYDWVNYTLKEIETAFSWNKPAIISSHRVNFSGHIDKKNREIGISALRKLLILIVQRWPEVEFMDTTSLLNMLKRENIG